MCHDAARMWVSVQGTVRGVTSDEPTAADLSEPAEDEERSTLHDGRGRPTFGSAAKVNSGSLFACVRGTTPREVQSVTGKQASPTRREALSH